MLIIIGLFISNTILLYMFIKGPKMHKMAKTVVIDKLHFDEAQIKTYDTYIQHHMKAIDDNEMAMNNLRTELYKLLQYEQVSVNVDSVISKIAALQYNAEKINYTHFLEVKSLCKPSQQQDFIALTSEIATLFSRKEMK